MKDIQRRMFEMSHYHVVDPESDEYNWSLWQDACAAKEKAIEGIKTSGIAMQVWLGISMLFLAIWFFGDLWNGSKDHNAYAITEFGESYCAKGADGRRILDEQLLTQDGYTIKVTCADVTVSEAY